MPSNQCPISKAQCEQLLAFLNLGAIVSDAHHAASVSTSCIAIGGERASGSTSNVVGTSAQTNLNFNSALMSGTNSNVPFVPTLEHFIFSTETVDRKIFSETDWVLDTRATNYMVHSVSCFTSVTATLNSFVNLPNDESALVTHAGTMKISKTLTLTNVLCVPSFSFNLLSVGQLAKTILCCLIFFGNMNLLTRAQLVLVKSSKAYTCWKRVYQPQEIVFLQLVLKIILLFSQVFGISGWGIYQILNWL